ncbi:hypothetical protein H4R21_004822 [Coemansia helicoidea]|uniref:Uncharacterized protein n=1 Tax=Coemansia helicoidea TaxID=1286919 RepID=A0ACC1KVQ4_9FUNG|nr:hypothetical protein H4R21_004822 [Coemansia helicoidea]
MRAVASKWRAVELNVATYSKSYEFIHSDRAADQFAGDIAETCDALTTLMPGVNRLEFGESCSNAIAQLLYGRMASLYAKQLLWLDIDDSIIAPPGCQFPRLKRLSLDRLSLAGHQFPQIASGELVDLRFCGGPVNHSWASFSTDSDSQVIEFTNLKRLHAEYSDLFSDNVDSARYQDGHPWELHFPSLESLSISSDQGICNLLEYAVLPPRMESISINMVSAAYEDIEDLVLPVTKHISLRIVVNSARDTSGLAAINRILEDVHECETLKLTIRAHRLEQKLEPYDSTYTALTHLELYATTDVDYMLAIIDNLPNLVELKHSLLDWGELGPEDLDHEVHENEPEPMHASLQTLDIGFHWKERYRGMEVLLVQYLLLGIPTLTKLVSSRTPGIPVRKFVAEYAPRYPHLLSVNLTLNEVADFPESEPELEYSE